MSGNIFFRFTRRTLRKNRVRTIVTITGIILSMALMTAVLEGAWSGIRYLMNILTEQEGSWNGAVRGLDEQQAQILKSADEVSDTCTWQLGGWAEIGSENEYKPYLLIESIEDTDQSLTAIKMISGRMPENENEIIIPAHLKSNGGIEWDVSDTITLNVGKREYAGGSGEEISRTAEYDPQAPEIIADASEKTYLITGTYERLSLPLEEFSCPGYTAFTRGGAEGTYTVFYTLKDPRSIYTFSEKYAFTDDILIHSQLIRFYGVTGYGNINQIIFGFAAILIVLIAVGSVSLIYNSFSISVSERTRQFGILKSTGATRKQIRSSVIYEALYLSLFGIPAGAAVGCAGIGITLYLLRNAIGRFAGADVDTRIRLEVSPLIIAVTMALCLITTLISAMIPAARAMKLSPIDAIRQSRDVRIKRSAVKTSPLTQKLFGFEGMMASKNFKRNRRRYRSVVFSLSLSIVLFISASSLSSYMMRSVTEGFDALYGEQYDVSTYISCDDADRVRSDIEKITGVDECIMCMDAGLRTFGADADMITDKALSEGMADHSGDEIRGMINIIFTDDDTFGRICKELGADASLFYDSSAPRAMVYNTVRYYETEKDSMYIHKTELFNNSAAGKTVRIYEPQKMDGKVFSHLTGSDEDNNVYAVYINTEEPYDQVIYPADEVCKEISLEVGTLMDRSYCFVNSSYASFIYPYSMIDSVIESYSSTEDDQETRSISFYIMAARHAQAAEGIKEYIEATSLEASSVYDAAEARETERLFVTIINVFSYAFIILISLIAAANVFNTISTSIGLRRREIAMLRSVGLSGKSFGRMMNYECIIYGLKGLVWGIPISVLVTWLIWRTTSGAFDMGFYIPWQSVVIATGCVFAVVFISMIYASGKIRRESMTDALKNENI